MAKLLAKHHVTGSGRGGPDPAFPPLFRENPASHTFFISFPNPAFLSLQKLIDVRCFLRLLQKEIAFCTYLTMKRAGVNICHIKANLAFKLFKKSSQDYNKSEAEELN